MDYKGTLRIDVTQQETQQEMNVLVSITDSSNGIPPEIMPKIFEPFFTTKPAGEGSGLGLDIVKKIVEKHQGKISVDSVPGTTTFTFNRKKAPAIICALRAPRFANDLAVR